MTYNSILHSFNPVESGDFIFRYEIQNKEFVIYSPDNNTVSCLNLDGFKNLSPTQLAAILDIQSSKIDNSLKELDFEYTCDRDKLISYLFDIEEISENTELNEKVHNIDFLSENTQISRVANCIGYLMKDVFQNKTNNFYRFNKVTHESYLLFDNDYCYTVVNENVNAGSIHVCWNPYLLYTLEKRKISDKTFLLSSANEINCSFLFDKVKGRQISIHMYDNNIEETLLFLSYYMLKIGSSNAFKYIQNRSDQVVVLEGWNPIKVVNMLSRVNKMYAELITQKDKEPDKNLIIYDLLSVGTDSYIKFHKNDTYCVCLLKVLITETNLSDSIALEFNY